MTRQAAIAAPNPIATQAGQVALAAGGNAIDAAIAAMVTATVTEPGVVSPLGGCYINIWPADGDPVVIDGNVEMPGRGADPERFGAGLIECVTTYGGGLTTYAGPGSVATPGMVAAMGLAHERYGRAPWAELFAVAEHSARAGFPLSQTAATYFPLVAHTIFNWDPTTRAVYTDDGTSWPAGHLIVDGSLADTLAELAAEGAGALYTGDLGLRIAADIGERGGLLTREDLTAYQPDLRPALPTRLGRWRLACNPPPSIGGPVLTAMLRVLGEVDGPVTPVRAARAMRQVLDLRMQRLDTAEDLRAAGEELLSTIATLGDTGLPTSPDTAHVSVVDTDGFACALTASAGYGSGMTVAGTGLMANNALGEPELNRRGLHALAPGTRMASNMAPTTARHADGSVLAIGTPGADRITTALLQVLLHFCVHDEELQHAINAPRLHVRLLEDGGAQIDLERDEHLSAALADQDLPLREYEPQDMYFGGVGAALLSADGTLSAGADPRRASATAVG
ncbi:gamma-glutamyltransferase [Ornithinicoccus hortensis]|uniref:Gamma-glutamyltranspeptidase/glutathione hydrolase n=1 Tax=Ornithinicoccus hortensis TaxID=82346 RepID=A0A542YV53_9MICO|nr:gamma-glutamyltransferase [Ornithinicoccus hortensis]TQL51967.1 gamma-glutamyltranspeptidase/glutathione hydrolase [Ornithinicoccus hortensis]